MKLHRPFICALLALSLSLTPGILRAGTTGAISGTVVEAGTTTPVANAAVTAKSASGSATVTSDALGHFIFLSLGPDTYTVSINKEGYDTVSVAGITVFADQTVAVTIDTRKTLKTIANVTSQSAGALVKAGTTSDIYSVNAATARQTAVLGGGGNLNNAYSAIASVPGAYVPQGQQGYGQAVYIRGGDYTQIGYEYDGVPVNRSFDNYAGGSLTSVGQQELQVYTGGATAGSSAAAISGFINQVIRTGTYPGFGSVNAGIGTPTYYHNLIAEVGGATPNRSFSYYAGVGGFNQGFRLFNQFNGGGTHPELGYATVINSPFNTSVTGIPTGVVPTCVAGSSGFGTTYKPPGMSADPGCFAFAPGYVGFGANVQTAAGPGSGGFFFANENDREAVVNLHFAIPHKTGGTRDDVQLLWSAGTLWSPIYTSQNDIGGAQAAFNAFGPPFGNPQCVSGGVLVCNSSLAYDTPLAFPLGTPFGVSATGLKAVPYFQPSAPTPSAPFSLVDPNARDAYINNQDIVKGQYQWNIGSAAYLRLFGYTFYSDWLINGPNYNGMFIPAAFTANFGNIGPEFGASPDYELSTHTRGGELQFADQIAPQHLITATGNYTTASTIRANNTSLLAFAGTSARATNDTDGTNCFNSVGAIAPCNRGPAGPATAPWNTLGTYTNPTPYAPVNGTWIVTNNLPRATFNNVVPKFWTGSIADQYRPSDKWLVNLGLRYEFFEYDYGNTTGNGKNFWFNNAQREFCYDTTNLQPLLVAGRPFPAYNPATGSFDCVAAAAAVLGVNNPNLVHPDGLNGHRLLTNTYASNTTSTVLSPRVAFTYSFNPNSVLRFSYGKYSQPVNAAFTQYNTTQPNLASFLFTTFWKYGFTSPAHQVVPSISNNFDLSLEQRLHGTDISFKLTPYYRSTENQVQQFYLDPTTGFVSGLNVGHQISYGLEFQLQKGNFDQNGFSGLLSYTYNHSRISYTDFIGAPGRNVIDVLNDSIKGYNALTSAGGGVACYTSAGAPDPGCAVASDIRNPYFNQPSQPLLNRSGTYLPFDIFPAIQQYIGIPGNVTDSYYVPNVVTAVLNYRMNKFAITPSVVFTSGNPYGVPLDTPGIDPRTCTNNSRLIPTAPDPLQADYTSCAGQISVPNPENGNTFTSLGQFNNPDQITLNLGLTYDITPKIRASAILANIYNHCFGGTTTPWTNAWPPGGTICAYGSNGFAPSPIATHGGFYNGSGPNDLAANGVALNPYLAHTYQPIGYNLPFQAYFSVQIKL